MQTKNFMTFYYRKYFCRGFNLKLHYYFFWRNERIQHSTEFRNLIDCCKCKIWNLIIPFLSNIMFMNATDSFIKYSVGCTEVVMLFYFNLIYWFQKKEIKKVNLAYLSVAYFLFIFVHTTISFNRIEYSKRSL